MMETTWLENLSKIFEVVIIPLLGILTGFLVSFIKSKTNQINESTKDATIKKYVAMVSETVQSCVIATNQTYVNSLKAGNSFDAAAQKVAFEKTLEAVLSILNEDAVTYLTEAYGDLNTYLANKIEAEVSANKKENQ